MDDRANNPSQRLASTTGLSLAAGPQGQTLAELHRGEEGGNGPGYGSL